MLNKQDTDMQYRKSMRLDGYNYSNPGLYFVTICAQNHVCFFGKIENDKMLLNDAGKMIEKWYYKLESKFQNVRCCKMVVMPNHFHFIIQIKYKLDEKQDLSLSEIVQWFKTMTTNEYIRGVKQFGWERFDKKLWQQTIGIVLFAIKNLMRIHVNIFIIIH